jgi:hypothetical protein
MESTDKIEQVKVYKLKCPTIGNGAVIVDNEEALIESLVLEAENMIFQAGIGAKFEFIITLELMDKEEFDNLVEFDGFN